MNGAPDMSVILCMGHPHRNPRFEDTLIFLGLEGLSPRPPLSTKITQHIRQVVESEDDYLAGSTRLLSA
jgi:hypothetical protein